MRTSLPRHARRPPAACWRNALLAGLLGLLLPAAQATGEDGDSAGEAPLEAIDLMLKWRHQFQFAGLYVAEEEGYFQRQGLAVTLHERQPGVDPVAEVLAGRMDYAITSASRLLLAHSEELPVVVLGVIFQHSPLVVVSIDSSLRTPADLVGKRVATADDDAEFRSMLRREGIAFDTLRFVPHPLSISALENGEVDALTGYLSNEPFALAQRGRPVTVINPVDYGVRFYGDVLFTSRSEWQHRPKRARSLRDAVFAGWDTALGDPERTVERLAHRFAPDKSRAALLYEATELRKLIHPHAVPIGHSSNWRWRQMQEHLAASGMMDDSLSLLPLLEAVDDERESRSRQSLQWLLLVSIGISVLAGAHIVGLRIAVRRAAAELRHSHTALADLNRDLEQRIAARTGELAAERDRANALRASRDRQLTQVTHELHSPLHGILGTVGLLLEDADHLSAEARQRLLQRVQKQARRLFVLAEHLLTSAHIEAGTLSLRRERLDLSEVTAQTLAEMIDDDAARAARIVFQPPSRPLPCDADRQRLALAIRALVDNALRYSPAESAVTVTLGSDDDGKAWLDVADRGPGIAAAERAQILARFAQGEASNQRAGGAGLGLNIAQGVAALHGGELAISDGTGGGAQLRLSLPAPRNVANGSPP